MRLDMSGLDDRSGPLAENDPAFDPAHRLMAAVSQAPIAFAICDSRFRPIFANDAARRLIGVAPTAPLPRHDLGRILSPCSPSLKVIRSRIAEMGWWQGRLRIREPDFGPRPRALDVSISRFRVVNVESGMLISATAPAQSISGEEDLIARSPRLTPRERQVVIGLFRGGSNKSVGLGLNLSPRTVEFHRAKLMRRFGAKSLIGLIAAILQPHA